MGFYSNLPYLLEASAFHTLHIDLQMRVLLALYTHITNLAVLGGSAGLAHATVTWL